MPNTATQHHDSKTTTLRPFDNWTIAYCRRCFTAGLMTIEDLQRFRDVFNNPPPHIRLPGYNAKDHGVTLAELMKPLDDQRPIDHQFTKVVEVVS